MKSSTHDLGKWLKEKRVQAGLTQAQLAKALGLETSQSIAQIEGGRAPLSTKHMKRFCKAVGITEKELSSQLVANYEQRLSKEFKKIS
jgi:transcriptional regulator with XRE-family HTH domain